jgi:short-subunit dehydrogenase
MNGAQAQAFRARYGPWALVAGASAGLGAAFASQLAALGLHVILVARRATELEALAARLRVEHGVETRTLTLDLAEQDAAATLDQRTSDLDVGLLIYNAARAPVGPFLDLTLEEHATELAVNVRTPMELAWRFGRRFTARGRGGVILMSSLGGALGTALTSNYAATKAYTLTLAEGLWEELRAQQVDVLAVLPAAIATLPAQASGGARPQRAAAATTLSPEQVAREALAALGHGPSITPGRATKLASFFMRRVLPRPTAIRMMGRVMRQMYGG